LKTMKLLLVMLASLIVVACGGGGGSSGSNAGATVTTGTAAQYFTKKTVGNTWTLFGSGTTTVTGQPTITNTYQEVTTTTASTGGVVTYAITDSSNGVPSPSRVLIEQIDATGALTSTDSTTTYLELPATFTVGTSWVSTPADPATGQSATTDKIVAFNVTHTVPAGTFTDCLQINETWTRTNAGVTTTHTSTAYRSPTAGQLVGGTSSDSTTVAGVTTTVNTVWQLQAGYIANP
jgi:hypothetical protein